jgi:hypothetical protein
MYGCPGWDEVRECLGGVKYNVGIVLGRILTSRRLFLTCDLEGDENDEY